MVVAVSGQNLTSAQIATAMRSAGWPETAIPVGVLIAQAESSGNPAATHTNSNGTVDRGLFQINSIHTTILRSGNVFDPVDNARMALTVYQQAGNKWTPWSTYNNGRYRLSPGGSVDSLAGDTTSASSTSASGITSPDTWKRVAMFIAGLLLVLFMVATIVGFQTPIGKIVGKVTK